MSLPFWGTLSDSLRIYLQRLPVLLPAILLVVGPPILALLWISSGTASSASTAASPGAARAASGTLLGRLFGSLIVTLPMYLVVTALAVPLLVRLCLQAGAGGRPSYLDALRDVLSRFWRLLGALLLIGLALTATGLLTVYTLGTLSAAFTVPGVPEPLAFLLDLGALAVTLALALALAMVLQILYFAYAGVLEGGRLADAIPEAARLLRGSLWPSFISLQALTLGILLLVLPAFLILLALVVAPVHSRTLDLIAGQAGPGLVITLLLITLSRARWVMRQTSGSRAG